jgi:small subunit ribosomal protein S16
MAVRIRLARKGRKKLAYYHIVVADSRSPRDGRYIEKIGKYNPLTNPATIELDFDKALGWLQNGAIPTETCRAILSYKGVLIKKHLLEGVRKGAFDEAEATKRFDEWMKKNQEKIDAKRSGLEKSKDERLIAMLAAEKKINEERAAKLAKKQADMVAKAEAATKEETATEETQPAEEAEEAQAEKATETAEVTTETSSETTDTPEGEEPKKETADTEEKSEAGEETTDTAAEAETETKNEKADVKDEAKPAETETDKDKPTEEASSEETKTEEKAGK